MELTIQEILHYVINQNMVFSLSNLKPIDKGHYFQMDIVISLNNCSIEILYRMVFSILRLENTECCIKTKEDCYRCFTIQEFGNYLRDL